MIPSGFTAVTSAGTYKKAKYQEHLTLILSNEEIKFIGQIVKCLENFGLLTTRFTERTGNNTEENSGAFLGMLLGTIEAALALEK